MHMHAFAKMQLASRLKSETMLPRQERLIMHATEVITDLQTQA